MGSEPGVPVSWNSPTRQDCSLPFFLGALRALGVSLLRWQGCDGLIKLAPLGLCFGEGQT
jgi:hypothetical protein